jgi:hypothetical protein
MMRVPTTTVMCLVWFPRMTMWAVVAHQIDSHLRYSRRALYPDKGPKRVR